MNGQIRRGNKACPIDAGYPHHQYTIQIIIKKRTMQDPHQYMVKYNGRFRKNNGPTGREPGFILIPCLGPVL